MLAEIETDKATMEVEAVDEGVLAKIVIPEGTDHVAVNTPIALIAENGEDVDEADAAQRRTARRAALGGGAGPAGAAAAGPARRADAAARRALRRAGSRRAQPAPAARRREARGIYRQDRHDDGARGAARRDGRGDAARRQRAAARRGGRRIPGRLQGQPGPAAGIRAAPRDRHADHRAGFCRARGRRRALPACGRSSSS